MRFRNSALFGALSLLLSLWLVTGCSEDEPEPATGPGLPSQAALTSYFEAITSADPDELARVQSELTADGSRAQGYAAYVEESTTAMVNAGERGEPLGVEAVDGGFKTCAGPGADQCTTWSDLRGEDGRLTDFTINGTEMGDLLVDLSDQPPVSSAGFYQVQPRWAYLQPRSGTLFVVCVVTASEVPLSPKPGIYVAGDQIVDGGEAPSPATIDAGTSSPIVLAFPEAQDVTLDGQVTFDLEIGDATTDSIGFGLADPTA